MGDLEAQIASAELGVQRFQELLRTYGKDTVLQATRQLMDYTEAMLRREIAKIPDGDYVAEGFLDDDGRNRGEHLPVKVTVRMRGDGVEVDLTGSSPQVPTAFNVPFEGSTKVACYFAFRALLLDTYTHHDPIPAERGLVPAGEGHGAAGLHLQPDRPRRGGGAFQPDPARGRPHHQGAGAGAAGQLHGRQRGDALLRGLFRACGRRATTGCSSKSTRPRWAAARSRTARTRSRS